MENLWAKTDHVNGQGKSHLKTNIVVEQQRYEFIIKGRLISTTAMIQWPWYRCERLLPEHEFDEFFDQGEKYEIGTNHES